MRSRYMFRMNFNKKQSQRSAISFDLAGVFRGFLFFRKLSDRDRQSISWFGRCVWCFDLKVENFRQRPAIKMLIWPVCVEIFSQLPSSGKGMK